jgi:hypothetical protein
MPGITIGEGREEFSGSGILAVQQTVQQELISIDGTTLENVLQGIGVTQYSGTATVVDH